MHTSTEQKMKKKSPRLCPSWTPVYRPTSLRNAPAGVWQRGLPHQVHYMRRITLLAWPMTIALTASSITSAMLYFDQPIASRQRHHPWLTDFYKYEQTQITMNMIWFLKEISGWRMELRRWDILTKYLRTHFHRQLVFICFHIYTHTLALDFFCYFLFTLVTTFFNMFSIGYWKNWSRTVQKIILLCPIYLQITVVTVLQDNKLRIFCKLSCDMN